MATVAATAGLCLAAPSCLQSIQRQSVSSQFQAQPSVTCRRTAVISCAQPNSEDVPAVGRREIALSGLGAALFAVVAPEAARADFIEDYKNETTTVIEQVRNTISLDKNDPSKGQAVDSLRSMSNTWVAKYRREKAVAGKPSFSNMYSVLNAISGHYISFGPGYPFPKKRSERILQEMKDAEKALARVCSSHP
eukprot:jgi/Mesen1/455/ME000101S10685